MSLLDTASLLLTPNAYKEGKLYSVIPSDGSGDMSVTRATTATRVNSAGLVELVPYNLLQYSEQFDNSYWFKANGSSVTSNSTIAPNGTLTADTLNVSTTAYSTIYNQNLFGFVNGVYTQTIYAKKSTKNWLYILDLAGSGAKAWFNLDTGVVGTVAIGYTASMESVGNGWYRCLLSQNSNPALYYQFGASDADNSFTPSSSGSIYIWGAQLVEGTSALDYQRTETRLNIPRLDYSNGSCPSLLVEPQRTNLALYSNALSTGTNVVDASTITANFYVSPDGTQNAMQFTETTDNSRHGFYQYTTVTAQTYTASIFTKQTGRRYIALRSDITGTATSSFFDLQTISVLSSGSGHTCSIQDFGNGWLRLVVTFTASAGSRYLVWCGSPDGINVVYAGSTSISQTFYGYQLEAGSYPTSYIPTTSASVTRNADAISKTGISSLIGQTEGTLFVDFIYNHDNFDLAEVVSLSDGTTDNRIYIGNVFDDNLTCTIVTSAISQFSATTSFPLTIGQRYKVAVAYKLNDFTMYVNGIQIATDNSGTVPLMSRFGFDSGAGGSSFYKPTNATALWKTRLTNAQLAQLTTI